MTCTLTTGSTDTHSYVGVLCGKTEYRIYQDRKGWFYEGEFAIETPRGPAAHAIRNVLESGQDSFQEYLVGGLEKWQLKERAGL